MTPHVLGTKDGMVNLRIGSRHVVNMQPRDALRFADQIEQVAHDMMVIWESRNGLYCPHGTDPLNCIACTTASKQGGPCGACLGLPPVNGMEHLHVCGKEDGK
jgi:hypothetical protein